MMMKKLFVWDFHGVLEQGNDDAVHEISNLALEHHGYSRRMTLEESKLLSGKRWYEYFTYLLPELGEEDIYSLQSTCFAISNDRPDILSGYLKINDHVEHVLESIHLSPHTQILISNSVPDALERFIKIVGIEKYFPASHRFGADTHNQAKITKKDCLDAFLKRNPSFDLIVSIGDSPGDMALVFHGESPKGIGYFYSHPTRKHRESQYHHKIHDLRLVLQEL